MNILQQVARRLERLEALDKVAKPLAGAAGRAVRPRVVRNLLSGADLGDPLHPMLTDLPIGAWVSSALLDAALNTTALSLYLASLVARPGTEARPPGAGPGRAGGAARHRGAARVHIELICVVQSVLPVTL